MVSNVFSGGSYFNLFIMPMVLEIVFAILVIIYVVSNLDAFLA